MCFEDRKNRTIPLKKKVNSEIPNFDFTNTNTKFSPEGYGGADIVAKSLKYFQEKYKEEACIILPQTIKNVSWENFSILWKIRKNKVELSVPPDVQKSIDVCKKDPRRFLVLHLDLKRYHPTYSGHTNILIYDKKKNTVERFEPHGYKDSEKKLMPEKLNVALKKYFSEKWPGVKFITPQELCHKCVGLQVLQAIEKKSELGFCVAWSLLYIEYRLQNPDKSPENIIKDVIKNLKGYNMTEFIQNYNGFLQNL